VLSVCVWGVGPRWQQKYDTLDAQYQQLNQTMSAAVAATRCRSARLRDAIKVTVNNELLFPSGDWQMSVEAQQTLSKIVRSSRPSSKPS